MDDVKLHAHEALAMTRGQALAALKLSPDPQVRHMVELMQAGPEIGDEDAARVAGRVMRLSPTARAVRGAYA